MGKQPGMPRSTAEILREEVRLLFSAARDVDVVRMTTNLDQGKACQLTLAHDAVACVSLRSVISLGPKLGSTGCRLAPWEVGASPTDLSDNPCRFLRRGDKLCGIG